MEQLQEAAPPTWESWTCAKCGRHNTYRAFCPGCRASLPPAAPTVVPPTVVDAPLAAPVPARPPRRSPRIAVIAALVAAGFGAVAGLSAFVLGRDGGPSHPGEWDPRVVGLVAFVEQERRLPFQHPVHVDFLTADEYREGATKDPTELSEEDREELRDAEGVFRAVGLLSGEVDLVESLNTVSDEGTLAFYNHDEKRVRVRGTELTPRLRKTLLHELTHALQDQHFDLSRIDEFETDGASNAFRAVVEGDANRIEARYYDALSEDERAAVDAESSKHSANTDLSDVPPMILAYMGAPYALGEQLVALLEATGGSAAIDDAMLNPPASEESLLDPYTYLSGDTPVVVDAPEVPKDVDEIDDGDFGALTLYMILATRLDPHEALRAVDGWAGDAYVAYARRTEEHSQVCVRARFATDSQTDEVELEEALKRWSGGTVTSSADVVGFEACESVRGADDPAPVVPELEPSVLRLPVARAEITRGFEDAGMSRRLATCYAGRIVESLSVDQLYDPAPVMTDPTYQQRLAGFAAECGLAGAAS
jgi:hypothetical protein